MVRRRSRDIAAALGTLVAPLAALAQGPTGSVTTTPVHQAPALGMSVLVVLAVAMAGIAMYRLRRTVTGPIVGLVLIAVLAGLGYAFSGVTISGAGCVQQTISTFSPLDPNELMSDCPDPIQIVDIEVVCGHDSSPNPQPNTDGASECSVGQILIKGGACRLPECA